MVLYSFFRFEYVSFPCLGFYFIPEALSLDEQMLWIKESLTNFPEPPNRTNHTAFHGPISNLWNRAQNEEMMEESEDHKGNANSNMMNQTEGNTPVKSSSQAFAVSARKDDFSANGEYVADQVSKQTNPHFGDRQQHVQESNIDMNNSAVKKMIPMKTLLRKLRWATVGLQFDWSKVWLGICFRFCFLTMIRNLTAP